MKKPIIEFKNVSKVFEDNNTVVLKDINFELEEGKFYTLLGASGSEMCIRDSSYALIFYLKEAIVYGITLGFFLIIMVLSGVLYFHYANKFKKALE